MNRDEAGRVITAHMKPIYGFALKRCADMQDAEDLTQEICLKLYRALLLRDDIRSTDKFVWTVAHNILANYYRGRRLSGIGVSLDELAEILPSEEDVAGTVVEKDAVHRLRREIAYLSKLQRSIVIAYYYEGKKQEEIARGLGLPLGTVKWHLFEAKKELKKGMETMRPSTELAFHPVVFECIGTSGNPGQKGGNHNFFRSPLVQNIVYSVRCKPKTVGEIAADLGVSPVYVESEAAYLADYGFLLQQGDRYVSNILLQEPTTELLRLEHTMYQQAAKLIANDLYEELTNSGLPDSDGIVCGQTADLTMTDSPKVDRNFLLWALIPYLAALGGEKTMENTVSFEEAATIRPDGGQNICYASVRNDQLVLPPEFNAITDWFGPSWNANRNWTLWQIDTEWSEKRVADLSVQTIRRDIDLLEQVVGDELLSRGEYAHLCERGYLKTVGDIDTKFKASLQIVWICDTQTKQRLLAIGDRVKEKHRAALQVLKAPYVAMKLQDTPKHLRKMQQFTLQYIFYSDGPFLWYCLKELLDNGKLQPPTADQRKALTTLFLPND